MAEAKTNEPSMEEILASIRRIIAEDGEAPKGEASAEPGAAPAAEAGSQASIDEILELTEVVEADGPAAAHDPDPEPEPPPPPRRAEPPRGAPAAMADDRLVSAAAAAASVAALSQLSGLRRDRKDAPVALGNGQLTIEDIVRELLRPMLRDWLDANLPGLVERLVREEVSRIVREAERG
jgi:cell pole-organizing protein PopZ